MLKVAAVEIGEPNSNSCRIRSIHLHAKTIRNGMDTSLLRPPMGYLLRLLSVNPYIHPDILTS